MEVRAAEASELEPLTTLWFEGWQDAHAQIVPEELTRLRTRDSFRERLRAALSDVRVAGPPGAPLGFHLLKDDELYQLYVSAQARGSGVATSLIADAERVLADRGVQTAWLGCAIGNDRAARFYEKSGWRLARTITSELETPEGLFELDVWRFEKELRP